MWVDKVQVGIDLATSVTILIAAGTFWANARKERKIGVADSARSTIIDNINASITSMANSFNSFVRLSTAIERKIDIPFKRGEDSFLKYIGEDKLSAEEVAKLFSESLTAMGEFYEKGEMLKYTIFPSLYSIGDEAEAVDIIRKEIDDVLHSYNISNSVYLSYFASILALRSKMESIKSRSEAYSSSNVSGEISRVIDDADHFVFVRGFLRAEHEKDFESGLAKNAGEMSEDEVNARMIAANIVLGLMDEKPEVILAHAFKMLSTKIQENRIQCKEFLVTLSAVSSKMQQRSSDFSIKKAYADLSSERYFDTKGTIR
ncbi:hypothetical protein [Pseudomonas fulva]|uniref:hypothetical protein n=1 Tax=Pseudomonas fulva TaxID=47880 RepID=UPI000F782B5E|nr:hypothetical protein [Pseudomonas fulva]MBA1209396.1 hypothetical protein [Pseudomonas fulva]MBA1217784.1 hypothetical protein [Pseudomonas fulva]MDH0573264.1 hypothetical protein [Pseudomonas fulva]RRW56926.1 hypothetical protein EGJ51_21375 [Pseudomonas fulva]